MALSGKEYPHEEGVDGEAYVYVLAKAPSTPSSPLRIAVPSATSDEVLFPTSTLYGPGVYLVDPQSTGRHNLRAAPRVAAPIVGTLIGGDVVDVAKVVTVRVPGADNTISAREHWAQLLRTSPGPPIWTLLASSGDQVFLRYVQRFGPKGGNAGVKVGSSTDVSELDRTIADLLGNPDTDDSEISALIQKLADHELETSVDKATASRMEDSWQQASDQTKKIKADNLAKQFQEQTMKAAQTKKREQREAWELERPQIGMKRMQGLAVLETSLSAHETEYKDRLRQLRDRRVAERFTDSSLEPSTFATESQKDNGMLEVVGDIEELQESAATTTKNARGTASDAARSLAGVSDTTLAETLVAMEAATAFSYRKLAFDR